MRNENKSEIVAVYGTLKRGLENHHLLAKSRFLGADYLDTIVLHDLGEFPGACFAASNGIYVEVYAIDTPTLLLLDQLEEIDAQAPHAGLYRRERIATCYGEAWIYLFNGEVDDQRQINAGSWLPVKPEIACAETQPED